MLLKVNYRPSDVQLHPCMTHHFTVLDEDLQPIPRVQAFDTETLVAIQANGTAVNAASFGWFPPNQEAYDELLLYLPRLYHPMVHITPSESHDA